MHFSNLPVSVPVASQNLKFVRNCGIIIIESEEIVLNNSNTKQIKGGEITDYKNSFVLYESVYCQYARLQARGKSDDARALIEAVMQYGLYQTIPEDDSIVWDLGFDGVIATINAAKTKYNQRIDIPEADLRALMDAGHTQKQIAEYYQCSVDTIQRRIKQYGIKPQKTASNYNENENEKENLKGD